MRMKKIRCAVIGYGWAGQRHADTIFHSQWADLAAVIDRNPSAREKCAAEYPVPVYDDLEKALSHEHFDAAVIATLPPTHMEICEHLIRSGIHVLCEKPLCRSAEDIVRLNEMAEQNQVKLGVVFNQRYGYAVQTAKRLLLEDDSPRQLITASMYQDFPKKPVGHFDRLYLLTDSCCHLLDLMTFLVGPATDGSAIGTVNEYGIVSNIAATLQFANGCIGSMTHSVYGGSHDTQHPFQQIDIHTAKARYSLENCTGKLTVFPHGSDARSIYEPSAFVRKEYDSTLRDACNDFLKAIALDNAVPAPAQDAWNNMLIIGKLCSSMISVNQTGKEGR